MTSTRHGCKTAALAAFTALATLVALPARATGDAGFERPAKPDITFVQFESPNLAAPGVPLTLQGKFSRPHAAERHGGHGQRKLPAVLILHGSAGIDARGDFYEAALNAAGIATLQIDMWQARGYTSPGQRPSAPILTYPDAFSALAFLARQPGIDGSRVGVLGFSWGGLVSLGAAERLYAGQFGSGLTFKAHVAHYPVCYAWNNTALLAAVHSTPAQYGVQWLALTGAPVLIQVGTRDAYDNSSAPCEALAQAANASNGGVVSVATYPDATHGWDRLMVPISVTDPFANQGSYFSTGVPPTVQLAPDARQAYQARERVVRFFSRQL
ncbi:dienelactone hydrolase family protein [Roseateles sp. BYS96W]|uniref:Dienelactone hydrolase family protein n=1 Tax=Pelomonas nitida TaxID=3299027 RepID=A0ABW7GAS2_9BURK